MGVVSRHSHEFPLDSMSVPGVLHLAPTQSRDVLLRELDRSNPQGPHFRQFLESPSLRMLPGGVPVPRIVTQRHSLPSLVSQDLNLPVTQVSTTNHLERESSLGRQGGLGGEVEGGVLLPVQLHPEEKLGVPQIVQYSSVPS